VINTAQRPKRKIEKNKLAAPKKERPENIGTHHLSVGGLGRGVRIKQMGKKEKTNQIICFPRKLELPDLRKKLKKSHSMILTLTRIAYRKFAEVLR